MIARVKTADGTAYDTVVFAVIRDSFSSRIIGFDEEYTTLEYINIYHSSPSIVQNVIFMDSSKDGWIDNGLMSGYDFIIGNDTLLRLIKQDRYIPESILQRCIDMQSEVCIPEWIEVCDSESAENLLSAAGGFHDGVITGVEWHNGRCDVTFKVWGGSVTLRCTSCETSQNCQVGFGEWGEIFDAGIFFEGGRTIWVDECSVTSTADVTEDCCYVSADKIFWKIQLN